MKKIFIRSPYYINVNESGQIGSKIELRFRYFGETFPTNPNYILSKKIPSPTQLDTVYNISNYAKAFIKEYKPKGLSDLPLNEFVYPTGLAPSLADFELIVEFPLLNGAKVGDTITFDNVGYDLPDSAFSNAGTIKILSRVVNAGERCFDDNTGLINLPELLNAGEGCFAFNTGTIMADKLETSAIACFNNNSGTISIKSLVPIGATVGNDLQMDNATNTAIFNVNIANATNNGGNPDGDIQDAISNGATVNYFETPETETEKGYIFLEVKRYKETSTDVFDLLDTEVFCCLNGYSQYLQGVNFNQTDDILPLFNTDITFKLPNKKQIINVFLKDDTYTYNGQDFTLTAPRVIPLQLANEINLLNDIEIKAEFVCEPKYTPYVVYFINRFGGWQPLTFFKASKENYQTKSEKYKTFPNPLTYDTAQGQSKKYNNNGQKSITLNTGWVDENYNELIEDLLLSERVVLSNGTPLIVKTESQQVKTRLIDKMINFEIEFMYNFDMINNV